MKDLSKEAFRNFIVSWNDDFPIDLWWRRRNNVSFNSPKHRCMSFIDMYFEYEEEKMIEEYSEYKKERENDLEDYQITGKWLKRKTVRKSTKGEIDAWFDDMTDLKNMNKDG